MITFDVSDTFAVRVTYECLHWSLIFIVNGLFRVSTILEGKSPNLWIATIRSLIKDLSCSYAEHNQTNLLAKMRIFSESTVLSVFSEHDIVANRVMQTVYGNVNLHEGCLCVGYIIPFFFHRWVVILLFGCEFFLWRSWSRSKKRHEIGGHIFLSFVIAIIFLLIVDLFLFNSRSTGKQIT